MDNPKTKNTLLTYQGKEDQVSRGGYLVDRAVYTLGGVSEGKPPSRAGGIFRKEFM